MSETVINKSSYIALSSMRCRKAVATLELVMALPVILVLIVAMVWLGYAVIGQAEVTAEARHGAWSQRFEPWTRSKFAFSQDQEVSAQASTKIKVSPIFDGMGDPEADQSIDQGNWDHRSVPFQALPNWKLYAETAIAANREGLMSDYRDARSIFEQLRSIGATALADALQRAIEGLLNPSQQLELDGDHYEQRMQLEGGLTAEKNRAETLELKRAIDQQQQKIDDLKDDASSKDESPGHDELIWLQEQILERLKIQLELAESDE